jgi:pseudouridine-5'-phosphate glycosidase
MCGNANKLFYLLCWFGRAKHITGAEVTPYILMRVNELTGGASLSASILTPK